jgi:indolepyruvate ferredoxin oxidoreductase
LAARVTIHHRDELMTVQTELAAIPGVTASRPDLRRRSVAQKARHLPDPDKRVIINELVCEGCGDCGVVSNCVRSCSKPSSAQAQHRPVELQQGFFLR